MRSIPRSFPIAHWRPMLTALGAGVIAAVIFVATGITNERIEAQDGPILSVDPASQIVELGAGPFEVSLMVSNVTTPDGLGGYTLAMAYDPSVINGLAITDSGFVNSVGAQAICPSSGIDNDTGILAHFCFTIPLIPEPGPTASGPQALVNISFEAVGEGTSIIDIAESAIIDPQGNVLAATTSNGQVTVGLSAGPEASDTTANPTVSVADIDLPEAGTAGGGSDRTVLYIVLSLVAAGVITITATFAMLRMRNRHA